LVGSRLIEILTASGYRVSVVSRRKEAVPGAAVWQWDVAQQQIEVGAVEQADHIVHLAGAGVADERWTAARKREIMDSRTQSTRLLHDALARTGHRPKTFVSASAVGLYGADRGDALLDENSPPGTDFLAEVTKAWEQSARQVESLGIRTVLLRIGIVLSTQGGALAKIAAPVKLGAGAALGSGRQWMSWIHVDDLCRMVLFALQNPALSGPYNAVGPHPATNADLTRTLAHVLGRPLLLPNVPKFALKLAFGELAATVLGSLRVSNRRIAEAGFAYQYPELEAALRELYEKAESR
jgi:hypothetical protein